jgi:hypothetical protein
MKGFQTAPRCCYEHRVAEYRDSGDIDHLGRGGGSSSTRHSRMRTAHFVQSNSCHAQRERKYSGPTSSGRSPVCFCRTALLQPVSFKGCGRYARQCQPEGGDEFDWQVADKVGNVWGLGSNTTKGPGPMARWAEICGSRPAGDALVWFHGGNLHQSRQYSQFLPLPGHSCRINALG